MNDDDSSNKYSSNNQDDEDVRDFVTSSFEDAEPQSVAVQSRSTKGLLGKQGNYNMSSNNMEDRGGFRGGREGCTLT